MLNQERKIKEQKVEELVCSRMIDAFGFTGIAKLSEEEYQHYKNKIWREAFEEVFIFKKE